MSSIVHEHLDQIGDQLWSSRNRRVQRSSTLSGGCSVEDLAQLGGGLVLPDHGEVRQIELAAVVLDRLQVSGVNVTADLLVILLGHAVTLEVSHQVVQTLQSVRVVGLERGLTDLPENWHDVVAILKDALFL